jgi:threonine dehydrogenase-like Zn-dependent dehydrogenase
MGKIHAELALRYRPAHLIVNDLMPARLDWVATRLGPKAAAAGVKLHTAGAQDVEKVIREVSGGRGADDIILAVGVRPVQQKALGWLGRGGVANLFGGLKKGEHILELDAIRVHYEDIKVVGSSGGVPRDMVTTLEIIQSGQIDPGQHVGFIGSLDQAVDAIHAIEEVRTEGKTILYPHVRTTALFPGEGWDGAKENAFLEQGLLRS